MEKACQVVLLNIVYFFLSCPLHLSMIPNAWKHDTQAPLIPVTDE